VRCFHFLGRPHALFRFGFELGFLGRLVELGLVVARVPFAGGDVDEQAVFRVADALGDGAAVGDALLGAVGVALDLGGGEAEPEPEPLQELLGARLQQNFAVLAGAGDDAEVGAFAQDGLGALAHLLVEGLGLLGCHGQRRLVLLGRGGGVGDELGAA